MRLLTIRFVLLAGLASAFVSCNSLKNNSAGMGGEANPYDLADNGGYTSGGFYGDNTPSTYNASTYGDSSLPAEGAHLASYDASAGGFAGDVGDNVIPFTDHGSVSTAPKPSYSSAYSTPSKPKPKAQPKPVTVAAKKTSPPKATVAAKKPTTTKKPAVVAAKKSTPTKSTPDKKAMAASGAKKGTAVKTVYHPPGKKANIVKVRRLHTVKPGDNLSKLSSRYGVTVSALKSRNNLSSDRIIVGQRLQID